mmetsp:Transcript_6029/g.13736  ORF Transcript_6029/g.13736 Transcript_6029/m.13736 type:complete len:372 (-) Transcript_6029:196-1311(-)
MDLSMVCRGFILVYLAAVLQALGAAQTSIQQTDVFSQGMGGYACHRVPSIVQTAGGALLAFVESRRPDCGDQAPKDINMRRSFDQGKTWDAMKLIVGTSSVNNATFRNPYAVVVQATTEEASFVLLSFVNSTLSEPWVNFQVRSFDAGTTWSEPEKVDMGKWEGILLGPGAGIQLQHPPYAGRLVTCGATGYQAGHAMNAVVFYSDDQGRSYNASTDSFPHLEECQIAELANGSVVINLRSGHLDPCDCRAASISHDGGQTWSSPAWQPELVEPTCSAGMIEYEDSLYFSNPASQHQRVNMTVRRSEDGGGSWNSSVLVWPGPSAYSVLVGLEGQAVGLLYERGMSSPYEHVTFAAIPSSLSNGTVWIGSE